MVAIKGRKNSNKNPPILSHEFVIQNHGDIVCCVAMIFVTGLMIQATSQWAYMFIAIHHNVTDTGDSSIPMKYSIGWKDMCAVFFYLLITIVMHAVFQEYIFDKISKRLHLSKVKFAKFNESSQLVLFYLLSVIWAIDIIFRENLLSITLWSQEYPAPLSFSLKLFFIGQLAYWLHCYPELYFQRIKKEDIPSLATQTTIGFFFTFAAYVLNFQQMGILLLTLHYIGDTMLHGARLVHFIVKKDEMTKMAFLIANSVYVIVRVATLVIATLASYLYSIHQGENAFDFVTGKFNVPVIRFSALAIIIAFQAYLSYVFISRKMKRASENVAPIQTTVKSKQKSKKKEERSDKRGDNDLPEVVQASKNLRPRSSTKAK